MTEQDASKLIKIEHWYQIVRTALVLVVLIMLGFVLDNQTHILNANRYSLIQISNNDKRSDAYLKCIAETFTQTSSDADAAVAIKQCLTESNLIP